MYRVLFLLIHAGEQLEDPRPESDESIPEFVEKNVRAFSLGGTTIVGIGLTG